MKPSDGGKPLTRAGRVGALTGKAADDLAALKKQLVSLGQTKSAREAARPFVGLNGNFAIALDATGSMQTLIDHAKRSIEEILSRIFKEASTRVSFQFFIYRDYDVPREILEHSTLTQDSQQLTKWLADVRAFGGGSNEGEAIHEALSAIYESSAFDAVIVAGDEPSLSRKDLDGVGKRQVKSAIEWAALFNERGTPIHTFVVGERNDTQRDFKLIAERSGGQCGRLDGSKEMIDMAVMAVLARLKGASSVAKYMERQQLTQNSKQFGQLLLTPPK